jgi:hypothetical protein
MADSEYWNNNADKNKRAGWSDTNDQDREWHQREQQRAEERARLEHEREERRRREEEERRRNR